MWQFQFYSSPKYGEFEGLLSNRILCSIATPFFFGCQGAIFFQKNALIKYVNHLNNNIFDQIILFFSSYVLK